MFNFWKKSESNPTDKKTLVEEALKSIKKGDVKTGMDTLIILARDNYPDAEYWLGDIYEFTLYDDAQAAKWYGYAAEHGHPQAQFCIANFYMIGKGVKEDHGEAVNWYRKAAVNGIADAQFVMGEVSRTGDAVQQNLADARKWYELALQNGCSNAKMRLEQMAANIGTQTRTGPPTYTVVYDNKHDAPREFLMGKALDLFIGDKIPQDLKKAAEYLEVAAQKGLKEAQYMAGKMYMGGHGADKDYEKALFWFKKADEQGHPEAAFEVAKFYGNGIVVIKNSTIADEYLQKAALLGNTNAIEALRMRKNHGEL